MTIDDGDIPVGEPDSAETHDADPQAPTEPIAPPPPAPAAPRVTSYIPPSRTNGWTPPPPPSGGPQPRRAWSTTWVLTALLVLCAVTWLVGRYVMSEVGGGGLSAMGSNRIGVIPIEGVIQDGGPGGLLFGSDGARAIMKRLRAAGKDDSLAAVIVLINSPGGSAAASHSIYREIIALREKKKVVACMTDTAASGGYYIASACDKIVAEGGTLTGSIGVIFGGMSYYGLMGKLGLTDATQKAGKYKDMGSPLRPRTAEERELVQSMLDDIYRQFVEAVAAGRGMDVKRVRQIAQGKVYTGAQAKAIGLVDELGNIYDAAALAGRLAGVSGAPKLRYLSGDGGLFGGFSGATESFRGLLGRQHPLATAAGAGLTGPVLMAPWACESAPAVGLTTVTP